MRAPRPHRRDRARSPRCEKRLRLRRRRVRGRAAARPRAHERRDRRLAAPRCPERSRYGIVQALRQALEAAVPLGLHGPQPGQARRAEPAAAAQADARLHARRARRDRRRAVAARTGRCPRSPPRPGCVPRNGQALERRDVDRRAGVAQRAPHGLRAARSSSSRRRPGRRRAGAAVPTRARRARRAARRGSTRPLPVPRPPSGGSFDLRQLPPPRMGARRSRRPASTARRGSTTCARRSPRTRSPPASTVFELARRDGHVASR